MAEVQLPALGAGEVLVENLWMSVDPYMRRSMDPVATDLPPWPIGGALSGPSVGRVMESRNPAFRVGDIVESMSGWQSHFISQGEAFVPYISADNALARREVGSDVAPEDWLGLLGIASQTGYYAISAAAGLQAGGTVVVSSGAGTVGSVACQVARLNGMRAVTSAGSAEKRRWLIEEAGVAAALDYRAADFAHALREACPDGIDLVIENASPEHLSACLPLMNVNGTILIAGFISLYGGGGSARVENFEAVLDHYLTIRAFAFMDHLDHYDRFVADMVRWRREGQLKLQGQTFEGLDQAPDALAALFDGRAAGKLLVRIAD
jgi:NADPH-dependent curcumin reductase CurA